MNERKVYHKHHLFSNSKMNRKIYGSLLDEPFNMLTLDQDTHLNKPIPKYDEITFRIKAFEAGYDLPEPSKTLRMKHK